MYKKGEDGLVRGWSFAGWKYWPCREKKLKIAMLNEAVFMLKFRFEKCKYCFANICAQLACFKYLYHSEVFNSSLFPFRVDWEVYILSTTNLLQIYYKSTTNLNCDGVYWNIWLWTKRERNLLKYLDADKIMKYLDADKMRGKVP